MKKLFQKNIDILPQSFDSQKGIVEIIVSSFNNKDLQGDIIQKGAFSKTIKENFQGIRHFVNHSDFAGLPIDIVELENGLYVKSQLHLGIEKGKEAYEVYKFFNDNNRKIQHSIAGYSIKEQFSQTENANIIKEIQLIEYSTIYKQAANPLTPQLSVKSNDINEFEKLIELLENNQKELTELKKEFLNLQSHIQHLTISQPGKNTVELDKPLILAELEKILINK